MHTCTVCALLSTMSCGKQFTGQGSAKPLIRSIETFSLMQVCSQLLFFSTDHFHSKCVASVFDPVSSIRMIRNEISLSACSHPYHTLTLTLLRFFGTLCLVHVSLHPTIQTVLKEIVIFILNSFLLVPPQFKEWPQRLVGENLHDPLHIKNTKNKIKIQQHYMQVQFAEPVCRQMISVNDKMSL